MGKYCVKVSALSMDDKMGIYSSDSDGVIEYLKDIGFEDESGSKDINKDSYIDLKKLFTTYGASKNQLNLINNQYSGYKIEDEALGKVNFFKTFFSNMNVENHEAYLKISGYEYNGAPISSIALPGTRPHAVQRREINSIDATSAQNYYIVKRTSETLTFTPANDLQGGTTLDKDSFEDGVIPIRLLLVCLGGGGAGGASDVEDPGAGGGSSGYIVGVLHLKRDTNYNFCVGVGGETSYSNGENTFIESNLSRCLTVYGGSGGRQRESGNYGDLKGGAGGQISDYSSEHFKNIKNGAGNAGGKPDGGSEAQKGSDSNISSIYVMSRADLNREIIVGPHSGGGIEGVKNYRGGGGGASLLGNGGNGNGSADKGSPGEGYGSGGGGGALIFMGLSTCKGGSGADGIIKVYY